MKKLTPIKHIAIYRDNNYNSFPSVVKRPDGSLIVGFRHAPNRPQGLGRNLHIDPSSKAVTVSSINGENWDQQAKVLYDDFFYGVQDPCLNLLQDGTLFATFFMWKVMQQADVQQPFYRDKKIFGDYIGRPITVHTIRSTDGGQTWDTPIPISIPGALRGNCVEMADGAILAPVYRATEDKTRSRISGADVIVSRTEDKGKTWTELAVVSGQDGNLFVEPNLYRTPSGKLVLFIRSQKPAGQQDKESERSPLYTSESTDNGQTWSRPVRRPFYSPSPFHVLPLKDGRAMITYGYRLKPYGIRAILLDEEFECWDEAEEIVVREDGLGTDIGYTSAVELNDGRILITYYYYDEVNDGQRYIAGTLCEMKGID